MLPHLPGVDMRASKDGQPGWRGIYEVSGAFDHVIVFDCE